MEDAFGFYLPDEELQNVIIVSDAMALIESKLKESNLRTQNA